MIELLLRRQKRRLELVDQRLRVRQQTLKAGLHDSQILIGRKVGSPLGLVCCFCVGLLVGRFAPSAAQLKHRLPGVLSVRSLSLVFKLLRGGL